MLLLAGIIAVIAESFIFNFAYFTVPKAERGLSELNLEDLKLNNIDKKGNELIVKGEKPSFEIDSSNKVLRLKIELISGTGNFNVQQEDGKIEYKSDTDFKNYLILKVENGKDMKFNVAPQGESKTISINSIQIDNEFSFNYLRVFLIFSLIAILEYFILFSKVAKEKLHITFFVIAILLGNCLALLTPTYFPYDEKDHFIKTYQTSRGVFGFSKEEVPIKWIDNSDDFLKIDTTRSRFNNYEERVEYEKKFSSKEYNREEAYYTSAVTYLSVPYIPSALGIFIGRLIGLSFIHTFYLGRIFSVIAFAIVGSITIKKVKAVKRLIFTIALLPAVLYLVGSYSADPMTLIFALAGAGIFINMLASKENGVNYRHIVGFAICISIVAMGKVPYAPLSLLILLVPKKKFNINNKNKVLLIKFIVLAVIGIVTIAAILFSRSKGLSQWKMPGADSTKQVLYILHNPLQYARTCLKFISESALSYFEGVSTSLCYVKQLDKIWLVYSMAILFGLAAIDNETHIVKLRVIDKIVIFISIAVAWELVITAIYMAYAPAGAAEIYGVQGRYFAPLMLPFLLLFQTDKVTNNFNKKNMNLVLSLMILLPLLALIFRVFLNYNA